MKCRTKNGERNVKKSRSLPTFETSGVKYELIRSHPQYPVIKWADILEVSTSAYYDWLKQKQKRDVKELDYTTAINKIFKEKDSTYGVDRICGCLRRCGYTASYQHVKRIMGNMGLVSIHRRRRQRSLTDSRKSKGLDLPNLVHNLNITEPFQVMTSDISYVRTAQGFDYLCSIKDVASGIVLAQSTSNNMKAELVVKIINKAKSRWNLPIGKSFPLPPGDVFRYAAALFLDKAGHLI